MNVGRLLLLLSLPSVLYSHRHHEQQQQDQEEVHQEQELCDASTNNDDQTTCTNSQEIDEELPKLPPDFVDPCQDSNVDCPKWSREGECIANPYYMLASCAKSCGTCTPLKKHQDGGEEGNEDEPSSTSISGSVCVDEYEECSQWAREGECSINSACKCHVILIHYHCAVLISYILNTFLPPSKRRYA